MMVCLLNFGARISSIKLPVDGQLKEMTVVYDKPEEFIQDTFYLGATCGPVANRISNAKFTIDNQEYKLSANDGDNCLHSGENNFSNSFWEIEEDTLTENYVKFTLKTSDLENGFPGNCFFIVEYRLTENNELVMSYIGKSDKETPINMTNHTYFSLGQSSCLDLELTIASSSFLERFDNGIPKGKIISTKALGANVRKTESIKNIIINSNYPQICMGEGLDHCFIMDTGTIDKTKAVLFSKENGVKLKVFTDQPAMQIYTGNYLIGSFSKHAGVCLECHAFVDAPNQTHFPDINFSMPEVYQSKIIYSFEIV